MRTVVDKDGYHILMKNKELSASELTSATAKQDQMSNNGHEKHGELAARNLTLNVGGLLEGRWMIVNSYGEASPELAHYDHGVEILQKVLAALSA